MRFYSISVYDYISLTIRVLRRLTTVDKRRFKVRLLTASTAPTRAHDLTRCACSHFFSRSPLCCVRFYCIPVYDYVLLTIRVSRRLTAVGKRGFQVRLFSASTTCWHCAHTLLRLPQFFSRSPPLCSVRF